MLSSMLSSYLLLWLGILICQSVVLYALWSVVRVIFLREDLFAIRDALWDRARECGALDDPAHRRARTHLNACINMADGLSIAFFRALDACHDAELQQIPAPPPEFAADVAKAYTDCAARVTTYVTFECASGWLSFAVFVVRHIASERAAIVERRKALEEATQQFVTSEDVVEWGNAWKSLARRRAIA